MAVVFDLIGLLCIYGRALLWSRKRRMKTMESAEKYLNILPSELLAAVVRGEVDLNDLAGTTLAGRGLDQNAAWVGFPEAARQNEQRRQAGAAVSAGR